MSARANEFLAMIRDRGVLEDPIVRANRPELIESARVGLAQALAISSLNAYTSAWRSYSSWAKQHGLPIDRPTETHLCLYVWDKGVMEPKPLTYNTLKNYLYGISHYLGSGGKPNLLGEYPLLDRMMSRLHKLLGSTEKDDRLPIYWWMLVRILTKHDGVSISRSRRPLQTWRTGSRQC